MLGWVGAIVLAAQGAHAAALPPPVANCDAAPAYHQLDFWIGDWDTFETGQTGAPSQARARVTPIAAGCAIHEVYEQVDGLIGDSILSYDPVRRQWQQTWVTNRGAIMALYGQFSNGALVLEGDSHLQNGRTVRQRITWQKRDNAVREFAVASQDGGKTWAPAFDVTFIKRKAAARRVGDDASQRGRDR